ncbi:glycosyltransferase [Anaerosoma tenue]|uniref:glycosyltransferase n=1 Tax=Anaerosoma tenue TaxID=2933588 RepID=UPI002260DF37|nr:glycosyltransferase [Anaerosoma tenue]MCK8114692.1 glycosyltransferase [Anaerosoma tenue]
MTIDAVLIVAFKYPPYAEVGGRRWARLSRHFADAGIQVHVLTVNWGDDGFGAMDLVRHPNIHIHRIPSLCFHRLRSNRLHLPKRVHGRLVRLLRKHEMLEDARHWGLVMVPHARRLIRRHGIKHVITTGAPYWANWWILKLKKTDPHVVLTQDLRDPWTDHPFRMRSYSQRAILRAHRMEAEVLAKSDLIVTITNAVRDLLSAKSAAPVRVVENGYEPREFPEPGPAAPRPFWLMHAGTLASGRDKPLRNFLRAVRTVTPEMPELRIRFWGPMRPDVTAEFADLIERRVLELHDWAPVDEITEEMRVNTYACLHFISRELSPFLQSMKVFEYAFSHRPILSIDYGGEMRRLVEEHRLGWSVDGDDQSAMQAALRLLHRAWADDPSAENQPLDLDRFAYSNLSKRYLALLEEAETGGAQKTLGVSS